MEKKLVKLKVTETVGKKYSQVSSLTPYFLLQKYGNTMGTATTVQLSCYSN